MEEYGETIHKKLAKLAVAAGIAEKGTPCAQAAYAFIDEIKAMKKRFGIGNTVPDIQEEDIPKLAHYADKEANPLYPVPCSYECQGIGKVLLYADGGRYNFSLTLLLKLPNHNRKDALCYD